MDKSKKILLIIIGILLILTIGIGISYAYWSINHTQATSNVLDSGCFETTFTDQNNISLTNQFPVTDADGLETTPYTFTITNTCTINASYQINLETLNTTTLGLSHVKVSINQSSRAHTTSLLTALDSVTKTIDTATESRKLETGILNAGKSKTYELRIWVDEATTIEEGSNKVYESKVVVETAASDSVDLYADNTGAAIPELSQGMIPVTYDASGNVVVADIYSEWYDYASHNWANAVLVNCADTTIKDKYFNSDMSIKSSVVGTTMSMDEILQMYVWIPRYKYLLWNAENGVSNSQAITIVFEDKTTAKSTGSTNGTYLTHPAFTFGDTELNGIWVGKFETSGTTTGLTIKPNVVALSNITLGDMFNATRNQELTYSTNYGIDSTSIDTHMIKNTEWGVVAYLSSSIYGRYNDASTCIASGCEIWINNVNSDTTGYYAGAVTGCSGSSVTASMLKSPTCASGYDWTTLGVNASTTGNIYGIYDMSGGSWEYVMGNMVDSSGNFYSGKSGLTQPEIKYYDSYAYGTYSDVYINGKLGDATKEILTKLNSYKGWYDDHISFFYGSYAWFMRGGYYDFQPGLFTGQYEEGTALMCRSFRSVLTAE